MQTNRYFARYPLRLSLILAAVLLILPAPQSDVYAQTAQSVTEVAAGAPLPAPTPPAPIPPGSAPATLTFYASRAVFDAAFPGLPVEDFEDGNVSPGGAVGCPRPLDDTTNNACFSPGDIEPGLSVTTVGPPRSADELALLGPGFSGTTSKVVVANYFVDHFQLDFTVPGSAVGFDLVCVFSTDPNVVIDIFGPSGLLGSTTAPCTPGGSFFGVSSSASDITRITILSTTNQAEGVDNVAFGAGLLYGSSNAGDLFTINLTTGAGTLVGIMPPPPMATEIEFDPGSGRAFAQARDGFFGGYEIDITTALPLGPFVPNGFAFNGLEVVGGTWYGTGISGSGGPSTLFTLDPFTGATTPIGPTGVGPISGLAYDVGTATMYGIDGGAGPGLLYTINLATGLATPVGPTGIQAGSLEFGPNGLLYAGGTGSVNGGNLYTVNPVTGAATLVGPTGFARVTGLMLAAPSGAPPAADLSVTKTVDDDTPDYGTNVTFTVTVTNTGPNDATGVEITDLLPAGTIYVSHTTAQGAYNPGNGKWDGFGLTNGAMATLTIVATVNTVNPFTNTATRTASSPSDPDPSNDSASQLVTPQAADLEVDKVVDDPSPLFGQTITYTITVTNNGPSTATGIEITDLLPAGLIFVGATPSAGAYNPGTGLWDGFSLTNGSAATLAIQATVNTVADMVKNTATRTASAPPDPVPGNDSDNAKIFPLAADMAVTKIVNDDTPDYLETVTFTVEVTNNGPDDAVGVEVTDLLPGGLDFASATTTQGAYADGTGVWTVGAVNVGDVFTLTLNAVVNTLDPVTNTAEITGFLPTNVGVVIGDPDPSNNVASVTLVPQAADLEIDKVVDDPAPALGQAVTYTLTLTHLDGNVVTGVQVKDDLPDGVAYIGSVASQGSYNPATGIWMAGDLVEGQFETLTITVEVLTTQPVTNVAVIVFSNMLDPNVGNNSDSALFNGVASDLELDKSVIAFAEEPDGTLTATYLVEVRNEGPSATGGVEVTDVLSADMTLTSLSTSQGTVAVSGSTVTWSVGTLGLGDVATMTVTVNVPAGGNLINQAQVTDATLPDIDSVPGDGEGDDFSVASAGRRGSPDFVSGQGPGQVINRDGSRFRSDLNVAKTVDNAAPAVGDVVTYTVVVTNNGPQNNAGIEVTDHLPDCLTGATWTPSQGAYDGWLWVVGKLKVGETAMLTVVAEVGPTCAGTTVTNTAAVSASNLPDPDGDFFDFDNPPASDNASSVDITVSSSPSGRAEAKTTLLANYPNPFNPETVIPFELGESGLVQLAVYDLLGRQVQLLVDQSLGSGRHEVTFRGDQLPTGVYLVRLEAQGVVQTQRITLLK